MTQDATAPDDPVISVRVDDIAAADAQARERGDQIVHPLTTEEWGVTRFFVRAPDGNVLNLVQHPRMRPDSRAAQPSSCIRGQGELLDPPYGDRLRLGRGSLTGRVSGS